MTAQADPFVRVYYSVMGDDEKFAQVYDDDARLACWLRLLLVADACYPAPAPIPHGIKRAPLNHLVTAGLVDLLPGNRYRIHGLQAEREKRSERAAASARSRWKDASASPRADATAMRPHSERNATHMRPNANPNLSEPSRAEPIRTEPVARDDGAWRVSRVVEELTERPFTFGPGSPAFDTLAGDVSALGADRVATEYRSLRAESNGFPMDAAQLIFGAHKRLFPIPAAPVNGRAPKPKGMQPDMTEVDRAFDQR